MHARRLAALVVGLGLAGAGVAVGEATTGHSSPKLQIDSVGCSESSAPGGQVLNGSCTYVLTDGRRFRCPLSFSDHHQTPGTVEHAEACRALTPIAIPGSWQRVFTRLYAVQVCLRRHGIESSGGPFLEGPRPRKTPIGELIASKRASTAFIAFYTSASVARRAEPSVARNARRSHGSVERRGRVTVVWTRLPPQPLRTTIDACAF